MSDGADRYVEVIPGKMPHYPRQEHAVGLLSCNNKSHGMEQKAISYYYKCEYMQFNDLRGDATIASLLYERVGRVLPGDGTI